MPGVLESWLRPHYERPGGRPFIFYVVFGVFDADYEIGSQEYRTLGVHPGQELDLYNRDVSVSVRMGFSRTFDEARS